MADIRKFIEDNLLEPLKYYPTAIQDTLVELIIEKLETLYNYTVAFPEIVTPNSSRLDILKVIANQFLFTIRDEADLQEQIDILDNILHVYNKRGSIDTIENMWKYYGGDLPRDVQVVIPSYNLFRYNVSKFSDYHVFPDDETNQTGIYEVRLSNSTYDIPKLREFLLKELVAAGNYIYFTNAVSAELTESKEDYYKYIISDYHNLDIQMSVLPVYHGIYFSGYDSSSLSGSYQKVIEDYLSLSEDERSSQEYEDLRNLYNLAVSKGVDTIWSGKENIFMELTNLYDLSSVTWNYKVDTKGFYREILHHLLVDESYSIKDTLTLDIDPTLYNTISYSSVYINHDLLNAQGDRFKDKIFTLSDTLLGESVGYEPA